MAANQGISILQDKYQQLRQQRVLQLGSCEPGDHCDPNNWPKH
jgi:hypothetical protein